MRGRDSIFHMIKRSNSKKEQAARQREKIALQAEARQPDNALYLRAGEDNLERVKMLMEKGCDPVRKVIATKKIAQSLELLETTAFHEACSRGAFNVVAHFINAGCDRDVRDGFGMRPQDVIANGTKSKKAHARILDLFFAADRKDAQERQAREEFLNAAQNPVTGRKLSAIKAIKFS